MRGLVRVVLASRNPHKVDEIAAAMDLQGMVIEGLDAYPAIGEIVEDGETFEANAIIKATTVASATGRAALGDDSGLVVDALGGRPGVRSARYAGPDADDAANRAKLLVELAAAETAEAGAGAKGEAKVARTALQNAASVAGLMLTTNVLMTDLKDDDVENAATGAVV